MPNWKKVVVSGSDASLNSLNVNTYISASTFSGKFTGSLQGSSSYALTSSYVQNAQTASYVVSASYAVTASNAITASYALYAASSPNIGTTTTFTQATSASTWTFIHNLNTYTPQITVYDYGKNVIIPQNIAGTDANTVTINFNASQSGYAVISNGGGLVITGSSYYFTQASASSTWLIEHPLNTRTPIVQVYDPAYTSILTEYITALSNTLVSVTLPTSTTGFAVLSNGGNLFISGSSARLTQSIAAVTWSFTHSLNTKYPVVQVYDSTDTVIIPASITAIDTNTTQLTFATPTTGVAVAEFSGIQNLQDNTVSSSYARNADTASLAVTASYALTASVAISSSYALSASYASNVPLTASYALTASQAVSSSYAATASVALSYTLTSSFLAFTSSVNATTGALNAWSSSVVTTSSFNSLTASFAQFSASVNSTTGALNATTGALNATTGALNSKTGSYATTGSNTFIGTQTITGNGTVTGDWTVQGNLTAQTIIISSSVSYFTESFSSGSTKFGDDTSDTHQFTGSVKITGSFEVTGSVTANYGFTGSLFGTSSWAQNTVGAPYYVLTSSFSTTSASISTRVTNLESTASAFVVASASFSSSIVTLTNASASLAINSGSNSTRFTTLENASASFASQSGSNSTRFTILELASGSLSASVATLINMSASYAIASGSDSARITRLEGTASAFAIASASFSSSIVTLTNASASLALNSGSNSTRFTVLENASASFATNSGSNSTRLTLLEGTASIFATTSASIVANYIKNSQTSSMTVLSSSFALTASYVASIANLSTTQIATGSVTASVSGSDATFKVVSGSNTFLFVSSSGLTTVSGTFAVNVNNLNEFLISSTGSSLGNTLTDIHSITGSLRVTGSITGSMFGTSSFAVSSSNALTASSVNPLNQTVSINGGLTVTGSTILSGSAGVTVLSANVDTIVFSGSFTSTGSVTITGSVNILGGVTGSLLGTASYAVQALSSSYALTASYALNSTVNAFTYTQATSASTWTINHALNSRNLNVTVYDFGYNVIIPQNISNTDGNTSIVTFPSAQSGYAVLNPGGLLVTGSTAVFSASAAAVTWSFTHSLNTRVVNLDVYDASYNQVIPSRVTLTGLNTAEITFATATSGYAIASVNGNSGSVISSQNLVLTSDATNTTRYMTFAASESGVTALFTDPNITLNPSTNTLTVGSLTETSTIELKQNIKNFVTPLAKFMALKPVSYKWKANKRKDIGFIAEQVQEIFPEIVAEDGKSMSYTKLTPILIDMVQRQQKMIEDMNQEIKELKKHINRT